MDAVKQPMTRSFLILLPKSLDVRFAVRIEEFLAALLPRRLAEEPVAVVDLINDKTGLENNHVGDHGIVDRIRVFGDVEIFLHDTPRVGEERPVGANSASVFIRLGDIVGANGDEPAIGNLKLTMQLN